MLQSFSSLVNQLKTTLAQPYIITAIYDREFKNPNMIAPPMINKLNKTWISQLQFRAFMSGSNRCEVASDNIEGTLNT